MAFHEITEPGEPMRNMFGPGQVDQIIRQALQMCWMMLPKERQSAEAVEAEFRRIAERAIRDFKDDQKAFEL